MFDAIGHSVTKLKRTRIGPIDDRMLATGQWRILTDIEVRRLKNVRAKKTAPPIKNARAKKARPPIRPGRG
jgi:hypothetical protein